MRRPVISEYGDPVEFLRDMIHFRKKTEADFSVVGATRGLRRVSPTLVSLVLKRKRNLTYDRADEFSRLLNLNVTEKFALRNWLERNELGRRSDQPAMVEAPLKTRKDVSTTILNDWINVYVKDFFQMPAVQKKPELIKQQLMHVASAKRIERSIQFLLREGHLRRTLDGRIVPETKLAVADTRVPQKKIRDAHKGALSLAKRSIDLIPPNERFANALIIPLDRKGYEDLIELIHEFAEKLKDFATSHTGTGDRLHQLIVNVSPVGGKIE